MLPSEIFSQEFPEKIETDFVVILDHSEAVANLEAATEGVL